MIYNLLSNVIKHNNKLVLIIMMGAYISLIFGCTSCSDKTEKIESTKNSRPTYLMGNNTKQPNPLQFTTRTGHVLSFDRGSVLIASVNHMLKLELIGSMSDPVVDEVKTVIEREGTGLKRFTKVSYPNAWPGISVVYEAKLGTVAKSTYYVEANGGDQRIKQIKIRYNRPLRLDKSGNLVVTYDQGEMVETAPIAWQAIAGKRVPVEVDYHLLSEKEIGFKVSEYNPSYPLVIDPSLTWNSFLGGSGLDFGYGIAVDASGNVYVTGNSSATWGSPVRAYSSSADTFVAKLNSSGTLIWNTFLGGSGNNYSRAIVLDTSNNIYITGYSTAAWGTPVRAYSSADDAGVAKLDSDGNLIWHTFLGGSGDDHNYSIAIDLSNNLYVTGNSDATWGSPVRAYLTGDDVGVAKLDSNGNLIWNTFLGGSGNDFGYGIKVDTSGNVYVAGDSTISWGVPIRAFSSNWDIHISKLNSSGSLIWNTFLGGGGDDQNWSIALDTSNNIYVNGNSDATWGTPVRVYSSLDDTCVTKVDTNGNLIWNTFIGGGGIDRGNGIVVDTDSNVFINGSSTADWGAPWRAYTSLNDGFIAKLNSSGSLTWNTFLGGSGTDRGWGIAVDTSGYVYFAGYSDATWGAPTRAYVSSYDAIVAKIFDEAPTTPTITPTHSITPTNSPTYTITLTGTSTPSHTPTNSITPIHSPTNSPTNTHTLTSTITPTVTPSNSPSFSETPTITPTYTITATPTPAPQLSQTVSPTNSPTLTITSTMTISSTITATSSATAKVHSSIISNLIIYPNPFRAPSQQVTIQYSLNQDADISITLFSYLGVKVKTIIRQAGEPGGRVHPSGHTNQVTWDGRNSHGLLQATGGYICQIVAKSQDGQSQEKTSMKIGLIR